MAANEQWKVVTAASFAGITVTSCSDLVASAALTDLVKPPPVSVVEMSTRIRELEDMVSRIIQEASDRAAAFDRVRRDRHGDRAALEGEDGDAVDGFGFRMQGFKTPIGSLSYLSCFTGSEPTDEPKPECTRCAKVLRDCDALEAHMLKCQD